MTRSKELVSYSWKPLSPEASTFPHTHTHTHTHNILREHREPSAHSRTNKPFTKKQRKRLCADHLTKRRKVLVQQVNVHRPLNHLGESALALATNQQNSMLKNMGEGSDEEDKLLTTAS